MRRRFSLRFLLVVLVGFGIIFGLVTLIGTSKFISTTFSETFSVKSFPESTDEQFLQWLSSQEDVERVVVTRSQDGRQIVVTWLMLKSLFGNPEPPELAIKLEQMGYDVEIKN